MLDKILDFIADRLSKSITYKPIESTTLSPSKGAKWTATEDGMMVIRMAPTASGVNSYCYVDYKHANAPETAGGFGMAYLFTPAGNNVTQCIPMVKGATYSIFDIANVSKVTLYLYPFEKIGGGTRLVNFLRGGVVHVG